MPGPFAEPCSSLALAVVKDRMRIAGIAIGDIAAECSAISDLWIGNLQRSLAYDRASCGQQFRADQLMLRRHSPDDHRIWLGPNPTQLLQIVQVNQMLRSSQSELDHRN